MNQMASQLQTLQGAVAHTDMPLETGPTRLAPFSQQFQKGYLAIKRPEYLSIADKHMSQLPLNRGDMVIFNPAVFHQPGLNQTDGARQACLFQISCAWNVQMELLDRNEMVKSVWPVIKRWAKESGSHGEGASKGNGQANGHANGHANGNGYANGNGHANGHKDRHPAELDALVAATCDDFGYAFNWKTVKVSAQDLFCSPQIGGADRMQSQQTQAQLIREALAKGWTDDEVIRKLDENATMNRF